MVTSPIITTTSGKLFGKEGYAFLGIPFGKAERFMPAVEASWDGVLDCTEYGPVCPQPANTGFMTPDTPFQFSGSEEGGLNLNIWTPDISPDAKMPVAVYVHGGASQFGCNHQPGRSGDIFMGNRRMVAAAVNYRVGALGYLYLGDVLGEKYALSGSNAPLDLLLALKWIKKNIAAFGGDPDKITVYGQSAGAKVTAAILTLPETSGLFNQIWLESGGIQAMRTKGTAIEFREKMMKFLPGKTAEDLLTMPVEDLVRAQTDFCRVRWSTCFFGTVMDGEIFREDWLERMRRGECWHGDAVMGDALYEMGHSVENPDFAEKKDEIMRGAFGKNAETIEKYAESIKAANPSMSFTDVWKRAYSDYMYCTHMERLSNRLVANGGKVWRYRFEFPPAGHSMGMGFCMKVVRRRPDMPPDADMTKEYALSDKMNESICSFVMTGDPNTPNLPEWLPSDGDTVHRMRFNEVSTVSDDKWTMPELVTEYNY